MDCLKCYLGKFYLFIYFIFNSRHEAHEIENGYKIQETYYTEKVKTAGYRLKSVETACAAERAQCSLYEDILRPSE